MSMRCLSLVFLMPCLAWGLGACGSGNNNNGEDLDAGDPIKGKPCDPAPSYTEDVSDCTPAAEDYQPGINGSADDAWPACISDDNTYHQIGASVSSIARVRAYQDIAAGLWIGDPRPTKQDFLNMRVLFEEEQGLASRVVRRVDPHYPPPATGSCEDEGVPEDNPDYCVGPATLQPILNQAFADGALGKQRIVNAAKIHAALQWFLYVSVVKEVTTCVTKPADCDSGWAYYTGGTPRAEPIGLGQEIMALAPETHNRIYDGLLAVRCWRNLDNETGEAQDLAMRDRAIAQLDKALLRGMALLVRQRFEELLCAEEDYQLAALEGLRILVPLLDRATRERDPTAAELLLAEVQKEADAVDVAKVVDALDRLFDCP